MDEYFFPTNEFSLLETCQLYIIAKYKTSNCCKIEEVVQKCSIKKVFLKILQNSQGNPLCQSLFFNKTATSKATLAQVFSCEYCKIFENIFFKRTPSVAAFGEIRTKFLKLTIFQFQLILATLDML